ncbi:helix-turn-helix domain-containing protein [Streptomyces griseus]|uniref:helix-turn-helix domain-containing protein n=1 Tax=Streptomyces griseus TaxID=1911 RepID=UPI00368084FC
MSEGMGSAHHLVKPRLTAENTRYARIVGRNITIRRKYLGLSQAQLAAKITEAGFPISETVVHFSEIGRAGKRPENQYRNLSVDQLMAFAAVFECSPLDLLQEACATCQGIPPKGFTCNECAATGS